MNAAVLGAGAWGTALAKVLHDNGHTLTLWARNSEALAEIKRLRRNERYLPGIELPAEWNCEPDLRKAVASSDCIVLAVASKGLREVASQLRGSKAILVSVTKGIEYDTGKTMCGVLRECVSSARVAALSGPTFAMEVARGMPTAIVAASDDANTRRIVQEIFHQPRFRVYRSHDLLGVELGGALKNIIAIAAGVCDGLGFGENSKAALITRGIAEVRRLGVACGAEAETFAGLSGLGDLMVTCFSRQSRNRSLGERAGRGEAIQTLTQPGSKLAEGVPTARSAYRLARKLEIETPIIDEVHAVLYEAKNARRALSDLLSRDAKAED
ncbi:MAG TPA: NAD(P)H-dependent glycerol-3-phosphate dehydrogenase [Methylomirabilota bacterium]|nr:NAD(P)H-dependent glycerol-3-phosphate dehydrogenase [Methylomirabilota bacterium]